MRKIRLVAAALAAGALSLPYAAAQDVQHPPGEEQEGTDSQRVQQEGSAEEGTKVTGLVTSADPETHEFTIGDKTFIMPEEGGGAALFPQVGAEVIVFYEEQDGKNVITRIGQAQQ